MLRTIRRLAPLAALAVLAAGCDQPSPTAVAPTKGPAKTVTTNQPPVAVVNLTVLGAAYCQLGTCTYNYRYDSYESYDPDGSIVSVEWKVNGSLLTTAPTWTLTALRAYEACTGTTRGTLTVTDNEGATSTVCFGYTPA